MTYDIMKTVAIILLISEMSVACLAKAKTASFGTKKYITVRDENSVKIQLKIV